MYVSTSRARSCASYEAARSLIIERPLDDLAVALVPQTALGVVGRRRELREAADAARRRGDAGGLRAAKLLEKFDRALARKWGADLDRDGFERRVARQLHRDVTLARAWKEVLDQCESPELKAAKLIEFERASRLPPAAARIYQGRTRVIQRRFKVSVPRARVLEKSSMLRDRSER